MDAAMDEESPIVLEEHNEQNEPTWFHFQPKSFTRNSTTVFRAVILVLFIISGIPALILLVLFQLTDAGAVLCITASSKALFALFYAFTLGASLPTLLLITSASCLQGRGQFSIELTKTGIRQIQSEGTGLEFRIINVIRFVYHAWHKCRGRELQLSDESVDFIAAHTGLSKLPLMRPLPWDRIDSVIHMPEIFAPIVLRYSFPGEKEKQRHVLLDVSCLAPQEKSDLTAKLKALVPRHLSHDLLPGSDKGLSGYLSRAKRKMATYTDIWFSQLTTSSSRNKQTDLLPAGVELCKSRYQVLQAISRGGLANIYLALDRNREAVLEGEVVLKEFILPADDDEPAVSESLENCDNERSILSNLSHPGIIKLHEHFIEDHRAYLVLEYFRGTSLHELINSNGPLFADKTVDLSIQMCEILRYLHRLEPPVVHRDFTPHNLLLSDDDQLKLIDFNAALHPYRKAGEKDNVIGKPNYIPPEQFRGRATTQSDIYAMGATLYFLLTAEEAAPISESHPRQTNPEVPEQIDQIIFRATALSPFARYRDVDALLADLLLARKEI